MNSTKVQSKSRSLIFEYLPGITLISTTRFIVPLIWTVPFWISIGFSGIFIVVLNAIVINPALSMLKIVALGEIF